MTGKPVPQPTTDSARFWDGCNHEQVLLQKCRACGRVQFYPRPFCAHCQGEGLDWIATAGGGTIHSFTIVHKPANRSFDADVPFVIALVDLDEGVRLMLNVIGEDRLAAAIGRRVRICFEQRSPQQKLPQAALEPPP
jgi:uncharacterized OB-fold protein